MSRRTFFLSVWMQFSKHPRISLLEVFTSINLSVFYYVETHFSDIFALKYMSAHIMHGTFQPFSSAPKIFHRELCQNKQNIWAIEKVLMPSAIWRRHSKCDVVNTKIQVSILWNIYSWHLWTDKIVREDTYLFSWNVSVC
jgi:hypothetical protein